MPNNNAKRTTTGNVFIDRARQADQPQKRSPLEAIEWAFEQPITNANRKLILVKLARHHPNSRPTQEQLGKAAGGINERAVRGHLAALRKAGLITWQAIQTPNGRLSNRYTLRFEMG